MNISIRVLPIMCIIISAITVPLYAQTATRHVVDDLWNDKPAKYFYNEAVILLKPSYSGDSEAKAIISNLTAANIDILRDVYIPGLTEYRLIAIRYNNNNTTVANIQETCNSNIMKHVHSIEPNGAFSTCEVAYVLSAITADVNTLSLSNHNMVADYNPSPQNSNDTYYSLQWNYNTASDYDIDLSEAIPYDSGNVTGSTRIPIAVLDTGFPGIFNAHEDMNEIGRYFWKADFSEPPPYNPGSGGDLRGHGTFVTGLIAAKFNNSTGVASTAMKACNIYIYKVLDDDGTYIGADAIFAGIFYALGDAVKILNMSFGSYTDYSCIRTAIQAIGGYNALAFVSTGNDAWYGGWSPTINGLRYPAKYAIDYEHVIAVGATRIDGHRAEYSNFGEGVTVAAPGGAYQPEDYTEMILSTLPDSYNMPATEISNGYGYSSGTSYACAQVSGLAGHLLSMNPGLNNIEIKDLIITNTDQVHVGEHDLFESQYVYTYPPPSGENAYRNLLGYGIINVAKAIKQVPVSDIEAELIYSPPLRALREAAPPPSPYSVQLSWRKHYGDVVSAYRIERAVNSPSNWQTVDYKWQSSGPYILWDDNYVDEDTSYYYKVQPVTVQSSQYYDVFEPSDVVSKYVPDSGGGGEPESAEAFLDLPERLTLDQNYPNPFNPTTAISYGLSMSSRVRLQIMNTRGQIVRTLVDGDKPAGWYTVTWDGKNESGQQVASGIYLYLIQTDEGSVLKKMTLIR